jgi:nicotinamide-nucleotide amidase
VTSPTSLVSTLEARGLTIAVAESLTGGLLVAELISVPGASAVVLGGVVAYNSELKHSVLGVEAVLLAEHGAVHPDVAAQMATGVRVALATAAGPAHIGISTTGVAGPDPQDGQPVGTVYLGFAIGESVHTKRLSLTGTRAEIRAAAVDESLLELARLLE